MQASATSARIGRIFNEYLGANAVVLLELTYCTRYELAFSADVRAFARFT